MTRLQIAVQMMQAILPAYSRHTTGPGLIWDKDNQSWLPTQKKETYQAMIDEAFTIADAMLEKDAEGKKALDEQVTQYYKEEAETPKTRGDKLLAFLREKYNTLGGKENITSITMREKAFALYHEATGGSDQRWKPIPMYYKNVPVALVREQVCDIWFKTKTGKYQYFLADVFPELLTGADEYPGDIIPTEGGAP
jgi:hypothetical protein